ncbi:MAG: hypothetical protein FJ291_27765 [Planctomycetes bacterium]|nr:hypothetical protein [Planctomycetota bacterium]
MGVMTEQMEALTNGILTAARGRAAAIAGVRSDTVRFLGQARTRLQEVGAARRATGEKFVCDLRQMVGALLSGFDLAQGERASDLNAFLARHKEARAGELRTLFEELDRGRTAIREFVHRIHADVEKFLGGIRAARAESAQAMRSALRDRVAAIVKETTDYLGRCEQAYCDMSERLHAMLAQSRELTVEQVTALLNGFREARQRIAEELKAAAQVWESFTEFRAGAPGAGGCGTAGSPSPGLEAEPSAGQASTATRPAAKPKRKARKKTAAN